MFTLKQLLREVDAYNWDAYTDVNTNERAYLWEGMMRNYIIQELQSQKENIKSQEEFKRAIEAIVEDIKADLDLTFGAVSDSLSETPFEEFYGIEPVSDKNEWK